MYFYLLAIKMMMMMMMMIIIIIIILSSMDVHWYDWWISVYTTAVNSTY